MARRLRQLGDDLDAQRSEVDRLQSDLTDSHRARALLERDHAVAEARADELRRQLEQERFERARLASRIGVVEADREEAITSMGWFSRRRYHRRRAGDGHHPQK